VGQWKKKPWGKGAQVGVGKERKAVEGRALGDFTLSEEYKPLPTHARGGNVGKGGVWGKRRAEGGCKENKVAGVSAGQRVVDPERRSKRWGKMNLYKPKKTNGGKKTRSEEKRKGMLKKRGLCGGGRTKQLKTKKQKRHAATGGNGKKKGEKQGDKKKIRGKTRGEGRSVAVKRLPTMHSAKKKNNQSNKW